MPQWHSIHYALRMPLILSIETATSVCSAAIHQGGKLLAQAEFHLDKVHATALTPTIDFLLQQCGLQKQDLSAIAVSKGPGSYTGLRIGVAVAKGLCFTLNIPLIAVETLEAMALGVAPLAAKDNLLICPMLDARRMEVYCALFDPSGGRLAPTQAVVVDESFPDIMFAGRNVVCCGDGVDKCKPILQPLRNTYVADAVYPLAKSVGALATLRFGQRQFENLVDFEPYYLKEFFKPTKSA
jgi:tRNA threonylcarbamoyladenosine biosynthesis protein TsaB